MKGVAHMMSALNATHQPENIKNVIRVKPGHDLRRMLRSLCFVCLALASFCVNRAFAQMDEGAIIGVVTDSTGAVIPGAQVSIMDTGTGLVLKAKTNSTGDYYFSPIKIGTYTVRASASGFHTTEELGVVVHVTDRLNIPLILKPGGVNQTVVVTSSAQVMQTQSAEADVTINSKFLNDAPLANRNWIFIAQEAPGVTPFVGRGAGNGDFSSNGQDSEQNNYNLNGVNDNTMNSDYINGSVYNIAPPPDAIAEFKMETSNYSAEIGLGHAAVINATTKSGTNHIHGDVWEYVRNTDFDALVWNQQKGSARSVFHLNQFGATLGGPIMKNHVFIFGDIQDSRFVNGATPSTYSVPTPRERQGDFSELLNPVWTGASCPMVLYVPNTNTGTYTCNSNNSAGNAKTPTGTLQQFGNSQYSYDNVQFAAGQNVFASNQIDPVAQKLLQAYPCPNYAAPGQPNFNKPNGGWSTGNCNSASDTDSGPVSNNYQTNLTNTSDPINWDLRLDWNVNSRDLASFLVDYQHIINTYPAPLGPILDGTQGYGGHTQSYLSANYILTETHTFSPTLINVFTFAFNWGRDENLQYNYNNNISASYGLGGVPFDAGPDNGGLPETNDGFTAFGAHGNDPAIEGMNIYQIEDNVTKVIQNHSLKIGFEAMPIRWYSTNAANPRGSYSYNGEFTGVSGLKGPSGSAAADFLALGTVPGGTYTDTDNMASAAISTFVYTHFVQQYIAAYVQDDWRVTPKLTLNLGLRYEYFTPKREQANQLANFVMESSSMTSNGGTGKGELVIPYPDQSQNLLPSNLTALLDADNVQVVYTNNPYLAAFPKANWSPRIGAAYQVNPTTVWRIGAGYFMGGFQPGGGAANILNPPFIVNANSASLPTCFEGSYCESQYAFNNTLENGLQEFTGTGGIGAHAAFPAIGMEDPVMRMPYTIQYNLTVQQELTPTTTATLSYVGSVGRHLVTGINNPDMPQAITIGGQQSNGFTPFPHLSGQFWMSWTGASSYNSLQVTVQKRFSHGLSFLGTFTWAHAFDDTTDLLGGDIGAYKNAALIPIIHEWGQSGYDIRKRAVINTDYALPFGVDQPFVNHPGILNELLGGWNTDMEWWGQTGEPFTVGISRISGWQNANGGLANAAVKVGNPYTSGPGLPPPNPTSSGDLARESGMTTGAPSNTNADVCAAKTRTRERWFNPCAFEDPIGVINTSNAAAVAQLAPYATGYFSYYSPAIGADTPLANGAYNSNGTTNTLGPVPYVTGYSNVEPFFGTPKNSVSGPGNWRLNASLFKDFKTHHEQYLELRVDAFNLLNHPSFGQPSNTSTNIGPNSVSLTGPGSNQNETIDARFLQFSGKYVF